MTRIHLTGGVVEMAVLRGKRPLWNDMNKPKAVMHGPPGESGTPKEEGCPGPSVPSPTPFSPYLGLKHEGGFQRYNGLCIHSLTAKHLKDDRIFETSFWMQVWDCKKVREAPRGLTQSGSRDPGIIRKNRLLPGLRALADPNCKIVIAGFLGVSLGNEIDMF